MLLLSMAERPLKGVKGCNPLRVTNVVGITRYTNIGVTIDFGFWCDVKLGKRENYGTDEIIKKGGAIIWLT